MPAPTARSSPIELEAVYDPASSAFVEVAAERCRRRGLNLTPIRRRVLEVVAGSSAPVSAYDIIRRSSDTKLLGPPTVYRALEFLMEAGLVRHLALRRAYICRQPWIEEPVVTLLLCTDCGFVGETASEPLWRTLVQIAAAKGFEPRGRTVEIEGRCASCRGASPD